MLLAVLTAVSLIHQDEGVAIGLKVFVGRGHRELVNKGGDDMGAMILQQFNKMFAGIGLLRLQAAGAKGSANLIVQIDTVGHQNDLGVDDIRVQGQRLGQHHHGQGFAAALGVPDHAARSRPNRLVA